MCFDDSDCVDNVDKRVVGLLPMRETMRMTVTMTLSSMSEMCDSVVSSIDGVDNGVVQRYCDACFLDFQ